MNWLAVWVSVVEAIGTHLRVELELPSDALSSQPTLLNGVRASLPHNLELLDLFLLLRRQGDYLSSHDA